MPVAETLQPEAGDDRNKDAEVARLYEMYDAPTAQLFTSGTRGTAPGEFVVRQGFQTPSRRLPGGIAVGFFVQRPELTHRAHIRVAEHT